MTIQERISELLEERGWTKYKLAKRIGIYPTTVYDWFNGKKCMPSNDSIDGICTAFGITRAQFYCGIDENKLDEEQILLLDLFSKIPSNKKQAVFGIMHALSDKT